MQRAARYECFFTIWFVCAMQKNLVANPATTHNTFNQISDSEVFAIDECDRFASDAFERKN